MTTAANSLQIVTIPRRAAFVERLDVVTLIRVPSALRAPPTGGVQDLPADSPPSVSGEALMVAAHGRRIMTLALRDYLLELAGFP